jgi:hypothetical protein
LIVFAIAAVAGVVDAKDPPVFEAVTVTLRN